MMNKVYRYIFEEGSRKHFCPSCNNKCFVKYIDTETGEYLPKQYGRCDRESKCGYFFTPYTNGYHNPYWQQHKSSIKAVTKKLNHSYKEELLKKNKIVFIPFEVLKCTRTGYEKNVFIQNLLSRVDFPFDLKNIEKVISLYHLGTIQNGYRSGANTFPFIDINNNIRAIQVKQFNEQNHTTGTDFLHSIIEKYYKRNNKPLPKWIEEYNKNEKKVSCLFGEHLLSRYPYSSVALVEAPKTAIYGTLYFGFPESPTDLLWLAVYNLSSLNINKCKVLKGRNVYLFPDLSKDGNAFKLWSNKANEIQKRLQSTYFYVSDLLENLATQKDKEQGKDIADYLIKYDWRKFRKCNIKENSNFQVSIPMNEKSVKSESPRKTFFLQFKKSPNFKVLKYETLQKTQTENWSNDIAKLENYFKNIEMPSQPIKLNNWSTINNCQLFIDNHLATLKANNGNKTFLPHLYRLQEFKKILVLNSS